MKLYYAIYLIIYIKQYLKIRFTILNHIKIKKIVYNSKYINNKGIRYVFYYSNELSSFYVNVRVLQ